jgi:putative CocE/NonD family hydrolase
MTMALTLKRGGAMAAALAMLMNSGMAYAQAAPMGPAKSVQVAGDTGAQASRRGPPDPELQRFFDEKVDREDLVRIQMRDGVGLNGTLLFPKGADRKNLPTVLTFFPYQISQVASSPETKMFLEHGYAVAVVNARGRYYSEGTYSFMGGSGNDGSDTVTWLASQPWSNGKVGTIGCSSSAEEQTKINPAQNPHLGAAIPRSAGAGIGKVGPYSEWGNVYRGGVFFNGWVAWWYGEGKYKPSFPKGLSHEDMLRIYSHWNLAQANPPIDWVKAWDILPHYDIIKATNMPPTDLDQWMTWPVNDPKWKTVDFGSEGDRNGSPALYVNDWYDISTGPNLAMYQYQRKNAANQTARDNTIMVVTPMQHCSHSRSTENTVVGERNMGDPRFAFNELYLRWFDRWLKGEQNGVENEPKVRAYLMGANEYRAYDNWPPKEAKAVTYYLDSDGKANTLAGDGRLTTAKPKKSAQDGFTYDPMKPTPIVGGQFCCVGGATAGSFDQSKVEGRPDVLVYTSEPLKQTVEVTGSIPVTLYLSSDVKDTDLAVTLVDVGPDGKAYNLDMQMLRVRYREGFDKQVMMEPGKRYKVELPPLVTSNAFLPGHRIRVAIASSAFPVYERNLNTGGANYNEKDGVTAHNVIHHGGVELSSITLPIVPTGVGRTTKVAAK